jgi:hypothetical protein
MQNVARILAGIGPAWALLAAEPGHAQTTIIACNSVIHPGERVQNLSAPRANPSEGAVVLGLCTVVSL